MHIFGWWGGSVKRQTFTTNCKSSCSGKFVCHRWSICKYAMINLVEYNSQRNEKLISIFQRSICRSTHRKDQWNGSAHV